MKKRYIINLDTNGSVEIASIEVDDGEMIKLPNDPKKEGYIFSAWVNEDNNVVMNGTIEDCDVTASTELFVDMYDYAEEFMMPDDGVYTGARDITNYKNEKFFRFVIECINEEGVKNYDKKLRDRGFKRDALVYINEEEDMKISIADHSKISNTLYVWVCPSASMEC